MAAPRALMALKAAWPGVSRKVRDCWLSGIFTSKAPICCTPAKTSVNVLVLYSVAMHLQCMSKPNGILYKSYHSIWTLSPCRQEQPDA